MLRSLLCCWLAYATPASAFAPAWRGMPASIVHARAADPVLAGKHGRRTALLGAGALAFSQHGAAWAAAAPPKVAAAKKKADLSNALFKLTFDQSNKLVFQELGWGDAEAKLLSKALTRSSSASKLVLSGNHIADTGVAALAQSLRAGAAPKLKVINLAGNAVSEEAAKGLVDAREGLTVSFEQPAKKAASKVASSSFRDENALFKAAFEQAETLFFSELGWGDAEAEALSKELNSATSLKKLFLNGNAIQCDGGQALAASIRAGGAPNLQVLNLAGNRGLTEADRRALTSARSGLTVNFIQLKQASDAEVYIRADQGKLTNKGVIDRASSDQLVDGSAATCSELEQIMNVDRKTIKIEQNLLKAMKDPEQIKKVEDIEQSLERQVERLDKILVTKTTKGCKDDKAKLARSSGYPLNGTPR